MEIVGPQTVDFNIMWLKWKTWQVLETLIRRANDRHNYRPFHIFYGYMKCNDRSFSTEEIMSSAGRRSKLTKKKPILTGTSYNRKETHKIAKAIIKQKT